MCVHISIKLMPFREEVGPPAGGPFFLKQKRQSCDCQFCVLVRPVGFEPTTFPFREEISNPAESRAQASQH